MGPGAIGDSVLRLRVRGGAGDPLSLQLRLGALFRGVELHPRGLSPSAILCVRSLSDPLPGKLPVARLGARPPREWEQAASDALAQLARRAARPYREAVPDSAEAVLFLDWAEMLACFAADFCEGRTRRHWWWRGLGCFSDLSPPSPATLLLEQPECIPTTIAHLAERRLHPAFLLSLPDLQVQELSARLIERFVAPRVVDEIEAAFREGPRVPADGAMNAPSSAPPAAPACAPPEQAPAPWRAWVSEAEEAELEPSRRALLVVALMLHREPVRLRSPAFRQQVREWREILARPVAVLNASPPPVAHESPAVAAVHAGTGVSGASRENPTEVGESREGVAAAPAAPDPVAAVEMPAAPVPTGELEAIEPPEPQPAPLQDPQAPAPPDLPAVHPPSTSLTPVLTNYGGLLYLINVALELKLYGDFTKPLEPGLSLPIWDFIELLGERLLECKNPNDPVWALLAALAGRREGEAPGSTFEPPAPSRTLAEWIDSISFDVRNRLRLALGVAEDDESLCRLILEHAARIYVTHTRFDIIFSLAEHPIEIRRAGLDRNPGWVPAAGRIIAFHYE